MGVTLYTGPAGSGKTQRCLDLLLEIRDRDPRSTIWVVLPDRAQVVAFRRRFARSGGGLGIRIETMGAFVEELSIRLGCQQPRAAGPIQRRLVQAALIQLDNEGAIPQYSSIARTAGLGHLLSQRFQEFKRAGWHSSDLTEEISEWGVKIQEVGRIFSRYQAQLQSLGWEDDEGLAQAVSAELLSQPGAVGEMAAVIVDGFDSFSQVQLQLLAALADAQPHLAVTLPARSNHGTDFPKLQQSLDELKMALPHAEMESTTDKKLLAPAIEEMVRSVFRPQSRAEHEPGDSVEWLKARSVNAEVRAALRWIKAATLRQGIPLQECGMILTEPEIYEPFVREISEEYGLPLRFGVGRQLQQAPSMVALLDLLRLPLANWSRRLTLEAIRSPFFDLSGFDLEPADAMPLEATSYWGQVVEGIDQWTDALMALSTRDAVGANQEEATGSIPLPTAEQAGQLERALIAFARRLEPGEAKSLSGWVLWLEDLLQEIDFFGRVGSEQEEAAALRLREVLRALLLSERVIGDRKQMFGEFLIEIESSLERARYQPKPEWDQAALQVEGLQAARGLRFRAVAVVGLSEGQLPTVEREDPLIAESTRDALGLEPRLGRDQRSLFYSAISRANQRLLLTRPTLAHDGESWEPSPYWQESLRVFELDESSVPLVRRGAERAMSEAASEQEVAFLAVRRRSLPKAFNALEPKLEPLRRARGLIEARLADKAAGEYEGDLGAVAARLADWHGPQHLWSPSRLESFGTCPHLYLSSTLLDLEQLEEPVLGPDASQLGSLLHEILEKAYQAASDPADTAEVLEDLRQFSADAFEQAPDRFGFRPSPLWHVEAERFLDSLEQCVLGLAEEGQEWVPVGYEATFGLGDNPPLKIETEQGQVLVRGVIDRLDRNGDRLRVIDYKTGSSHLGRSDLIEGRRLQLPLYALAAERSLGLGQVAAGMYWAILSAKAGSLRLESFYADWEGERLEGVSGSYQILRNHIESFLISIRAGQFQPEPPAGGCPSYCPAANWCWRYSPGYRR